MKNRKIYIHLYLHYRKNAHWSTGRIASSLKRTWKLGGGNKSNNSNNINNQKKGEATEVQGWVLLNFFLFLFFFLFVYNHRQDSNRARSQDAVQKPENRYQMTKKCICTHGARYNTLSFSVWLSLSLSLSMCELNRDMLLSSPAPTTFLGIIIIHVSNVKGKLFFWRWIK